jgi:hypothetical protein
MGKVINITKLIEANKVLIAARKKQEELAQELLKQGDGVHEGERATVIVKDGKITILRKAPVHLNLEDIIA